MKSERSAFILLEIVVAVGLLVLGMAVIGAQIQEATLLSRENGETERVARLVFLAESKLAELDSNLLDLTEATDVAGLDDAEGGLEGEFGPLFPSFGYRLRIIPTEVVDANAGEEVRDLNYVQLDILEWQRDNVEEEFDYDEAAIVDTYYTLRMTPRTVDLTTDFGMEDEVAEELSEKFADLEEPFDPYDFDPSFIASRDVEEIMEILAALLESSGSQGLAMLNLIPEDMRATVQQYLEQYTADMEDDTGDESGDESDDGYSDNESDSSNDASSGDTEGGDDEYYDDSGDQARDDGSSPDDEEDEEDYSGGSRR